MDKLLNEFTVHRPIYETWNVLTDVERIAPCMPGAALEEIEGDVFRGVVKVKLGAISTAFKGQANFIERNDDSHRAVLKAEGRDTTGKGNASALITAQLESVDAATTKCVVETDLHVTGKVAQFGRGIMGDVSKKLMNQFAANLNTMLDKRLDGQLSLFGQQVPLSKIQFVALTSILIVTGINCLAVKVSGGVASVLSGVKIALVLVVGVGAFGFARGADWSHLLMLNSGGACEGVSAAARVGFGGVIAAMLGALWAYDGWNNVTLVAGEVRDPHRNLPRALIGGMLLIMGLYLFVNLSYFYVMAPTDIASVSTTSSVATEVAQRFLGPMAITLIAAALLSSTFGTLHTSILTGARVPYAMARDGLFPRSLSHVSPRTHVPTGALIVQAVWACILVLIFSSSFDSLTDYAIFGLWIFYGLVTAAVFILRRKLPDLERPYRTWGYPVVPIFFLLATALILGMTIWGVREDALNAFSQILHGHVLTGVGALARNPPLAGIFLIALGLPVYWIWTRFKGEAIARP